MIWSTVAVILWGFGVATIALKTQDVRVATWWRLTAIQVGLFGVISAVLIGCGFLVLWLGDQIFGLDRLGAMRAWPVVFGIVTAVGAARWEPPWRRARRETALQLALSVFENEAVVARWHALPDDDVEIALNRLFPGRRERNIARRRLNDARNSKD